MPVWRACRTHVCPAYEAAALPLSYTATVFTRRHGVPCSTRPVNPRGAVGYWPESTPIPRAPANGQRPRASKQSQPGRTRTSNRPVRSRVPLHFGFGLVELAPLKAVPTGFAPATSAVTRQCSCSLSYETVICVKPRRGVEPRPAPYQGTALPLELPRLQNTTGWTRTTNLSVIGGVLCPMSYGRTMVALTCQRTATKNGPRWGSNPRRAAFQAAALPAELPGQDFILRRRLAAPCRGARDTCTLAFDLVDERHDGRRTGTAAHSHARRAVRNIRRPN